MRRELETTLFEKIQDGDPKAFDVLARQISGELYGFILRMVQNEDDAKDILQDTFVRVWEKSRQFRGGSNVKTWIYRIAINLSYSHLKRRQRWSTGLLDEVKTLLSSSNPQHETEQLFQSEMLERSLSKLTPRQKAVVVARIYQDLPFAEISKALGCSVNAAKVHFHEGKKRIESYMKEKAGENG
jgi:RNA polymerase sigma-70 factor (ECF subfamily)